VTNRNDWQVDNNSPTRPIQIKSVHALYRLLLQAKDVFSEYIDESIIWIYLYYFYDQILCEFVYSIVAFYAKNTLVILFVFYK